ncbi:hypothetical protein Tco_0481912 [Tanacetum coccineum]
MPPRRFKKKSVKRLVEKRVDKAIEEYKKTKADSNNTGGSGSANTKGMVAPDVQGCSYKTFMNCKPHFFNGTKGVVRLKRWFEKMEQVFEICKCAEDDKLVSTEKKKIEKYIPRISQRKIKGNVTYLTKACDLCRYSNQHGSRTELNKGFRRKALRIIDEQYKESGKTTREQLSPTAKQKTRTAKVYVAVPPKVRLRWELPKVQ